MGSWGVRVELSAPYKTSKPPRGIQQTLGRWVVAAGCRAVCLNLPQLSYMPPSPTHRPKRTPPPPNVPKPIYLGRL